MARLAGKGGIVKVDSDGGGAPEEILGVTGWTLEIEADTPDATGMDSSGNAVFLAAIGRWRGTVDFHWDTDEGDIVGTPPLISQGAHLELELWARAYAAGPPEINTSYKGDAIVGSFRPTVTADAGVDGSIAFQGTGALTYPTS